MADEVTDAPHALGQAFQGLGVGKTQMLAGLKDTEVPSRCDRHPRLFQQSLTEDKTVRAECAGIGVEVESTPGGRGEAKAQRLQRGLKEITPLPEGLSSLGQDLAYL